MANEIIENERNKYKKTYTDMMFAYDDLRQILDEKEINKRTFINKIDTLKEYMAFLDDLETKSKKDKGFFNKLLKPEKSIDDKIYNYLTSEKRIDIEKLEKCSQCKCINCVKECSMNGCLNCREKEFVYECNKEDAFLAKSSDTVTLYNGDENYLFNVAGYLVEKDEDGNFSRYVYLIDSKDYDNQHILRYSKFKGEESYDSIIVDDKQDELIRINDKFIELGLKV